MILYVFLLVVTQVIAIEFPPGVTLCHRSDPNFAQCLAKSIGDSLKVFKDGYKELGIPKINPLFMEKIEVKADPNRAFSLEQKYTNVYVHAVMDADFTSYFEIDLDTKCQFITDARLPMVRLEADYELNGNLMVFPVKASGKYNCVNRHTMMCEKYTKNNEIYLRVTNYTIELTQEKIHYGFTNLFPGNEQIAAEILKTANDNDNLIFNEVKGGYEEIFSLMHMQIMNNVFSKLPMNKIFLD